MVDEGEIKPYSYFLRKRRDEKGLSQTDLANRTGLERTYISRLEGGKLSNPSYRLQATISVRGMGLTLAEFFSEDAIRTEPPAITVITKNRSASIDPGGNIAVPMVDKSNIRALLSGTVREQDSLGYHIVGSTVLATLATANPNIVVVSLTAEHTRVVVIDLADRELRAGKQFATAERGRIVPRMVTHITQGLLLQCDKRLFSGCEPEEDYILVRPNSTQIVEVIGRIVAYTMGL